MKFVKAFVISVAVAITFSEPVRAQEAESLNSSNDAASSASISFGGGNSSGGGGFEQLLDVFGGAMVPSSGVYPGDTAVTQISCSTEGDYITLRRATEESSTSIPFFSSSSSEVDQLTPEQITSLVQCLAWSDPASLSIFASAASDREYVLAASMLLQVMASSGSLDPGEVQRYRSLIGLRLPEGSEPEKKFIDLAREIFTKKWALTAAQNRNN